MGYGQSKSFDLCPYGEHALGTEIINLCPMHALPVMRALPAVKPESGHFFCNHSLLTKKAKVSNVHPLLF
jgi:hypothetical protein